MDPISATSAVLSLLQFTRLVARGYMTYRGSVASSLYDDVRQIALQIETLETILDSLRQLLDVAEISENSFNIQHDRHIIKNILRNHDDVLGRVSTCLREAEDLLGQPKRSFRSLFKPIGKKRHRDISHLSISLATSTSILKSYLDLASSSFYLDTPRTSRPNLRTPIELAALNWLSLSDPDATHLDLQDRRLNSSGAWLHDDERYERWLGSSQSDNVLWLSGMLGMGKTYLASFIIDELQRTYRRSRIPVIYFYCDYRQHENYSAAYILSSLLKQLVSTVHPIPHSLIELFSSYQRGTDSIAEPRLTDVLRVFLASLQAFDRVYVVVDALDECDPHSTTELLRLIPSLTFSVRLLITSRREVDIERVLQSYPQLVISTTNLRSDIEVYIGAFIERTQLSTLLDTSSKRQDAREQAKKKLVDEVYSKSDGSFLLANLQMQMIVRSGSVQEIWTTSASLPRTLLEMYTHSLKTISKQTGLQNQATKILSWIFRARRPLLLREMQQALTVSTIDRGGSVQRYPRASDIIDWCLGLVTVDEERSTIRFVHFSVQEFLQGRPSILEDESVIACTCLTFLNSKDFASGYCADRTELEDRRQRFPFLEYAARFWAIHGKGCSDPEFEQVAVKFLCSQGHLACATQAAGYADYTSEAHGRILLPKLSGLHVVASYGLVQLLDALIRQSGVTIDVKDEQGQTPIIYAAKNGHTSGIKLLAAKGAKLDAKDHTHLRSALSWATLNGHTSAVEWLLTQKDQISINSFDYQHSTPLHLAFERHRYDIVNLLIGQGASLNLVDRWQRTQAQLAFSGSSTVDLSDYVKDKKLSQPIEQGNQARVSVFKKSNGTTNTQEPYPFLFRKAFDIKGNAGKARLRLLVQERDYLRNLHHPNLVKFIAYEESEDHGKAYLWTEYCNGGDLSKFMRKDYEDGGIVEPQKHLTKQEIWSITADLAAAVSYLHYGVIKENHTFSMKTDWGPVLHRDVKPQNVVVQELDSTTVTYKLCDLGIAKIWDPTAAQTKQGRGTPPYMPPEVKEDLKRWTVKGDIYSLGATIRDLAKDFEDAKLAGLLDQCMETLPSRRPNILTVLQIAREELAADQKNEEKPQFLPEKPAGMDYVLQAVLELLERLCHSYKAVEPDLRSHFTEKLTILLEDGKLRSANCWGLDRSLALQLIIGRQDEAKALVEDGQASYCPWNTHGLTPKDIAAHDGLSIFDIETVVLSPAAPGKTTSNAK